MTVNFNSLFRIDNEEVIDFEDFRKDILPQIVYSKNNSYIFRGQSNAKYELLPSVLRKNNKDISVNISISKVLYQLGNKAELNILLNYLDDSNYQNRCATLNCISEIISSNNFKKIIPILKEKIKAEDSLAVKESLENIIKIYN